jgi:hypothetical protein
MAESDREPEGALRVVPDIAQVWLTSALSSFLPHLAYLCEARGESTSREYNDRNECDEFPPGETPPFAIN